MKQEHFTRAYNAIIAQGRPAMRPDGHCAYRAPDGTRCALGHLIPDDQYKPWMEQKCASSILGQLRGFDSNWCFYDELQECHDLASDASDFIGSFKRRMHTLAAEYELDVPA